MTADAKHFLSVGQYLKFKPGLRFNTVRPHRGALAFAKGETHVNSPSTVEAP